MRHWIIFGLLLALLTGCALPAANSLPTPWPTEYLPTVIALTAAAYPTLTRPVPSSTPLRTGTPTPSVIPQPLPSDTPTATPSPPEILLLLDFTPIPSSTPGWPLVAIQILSPGPLSKVSSPIQLHAYLLPGAGGLVRIELYGEDGRLLNRQIQRFYTHPEKRVHMSVEVPFEIRAVAEMARLQVSTEDQFGRTKALSAVRLVLLSMGGNEVNPPGDLSERCLLTEPLAHALVIGGSLVVKGEMRPFNNQPLIIELVTENGGVVGSRMAVMEPSPDDSYVPFTVDVPYQVSAPTWARLTLRQSDDRIPGTMYLYSQEVLLSP